MFRPSFWFKTFAILFFGLVAALMVLRTAGLVIPYQIPTGAMAPTIEPGDKVFMEGITYLSRSPRRGDLITFKTSNIPRIPPPSSGGGEMIFVMRLVGLPGEKLHIADGKVHVDGNPVSLLNGEGEIRYTNDGEMRTSAVTVRIPPEHYFVLGDNSQNSSDSRFWGFVPAEAVTGRVVFCYGPAQRIGPVR